MKITRSDLEAAAQAGVLSPEQTDPLWQFWEQHTKDRPSFRMTHVLFYFGGVLAIMAMSLFVTLAWESLGGGGLVLVSALYMALGVALTEWLQGKALPIPAGLTAALVVALTPLLVYGLQLSLNLWDDNRTYHDYHVWVDWRWLWMELATLVVGAVMLWRYKLPFLLMPVAVTLWYLSMDLALFLTNGEYYNFEVRRNVSLLMGLLMIALAFYCDLRAGRRYGFWLYLFGVMAFWGGLSFRDSGDELARFMYFLINLGLIGVGVMLRRRVFVVFGGLGSFAYLSYITWRVFQDSLLLPVGLSFLGLGTIWLGVLWQRHMEQFGQHLRAALPERLRQVIEEGD